MSSIKKKENGKEYYTSATAKHIVRNLENESYVVTAGGFVGGFVPVGDPIIAAAATATGQVIGLQRTARNIRDAIGTKGVVLEYIGLLATERWSPWN